MLYSDRILKATMHRFALAAWLFLFVVLAVSGQEAITREKRTQLKAIAKGQDYSQWYLIESDPAPPGYVVADAQLTFDGRVACGPTAQCIEAERTPEHSIWLFRITNKDAAPSSSTAILTAHYRKRDSAEPAYTSVKRTPARFSGFGGSLGCFNTAPKAPSDEQAWCSITSDPPKAGYRIKSANFSLSGDRNCAGNDFDQEERDQTAECRLAKRTGTEVTWQFRMLGHIERGGPAAGQSIGELRTVYEKLP